MYILRCVCVPTCKSVSVCALNNSEINVSSVMLCCVRTSYVHVTDFYCLIFTTKNPRADNYFIQYLWPCRGNDKL